jgi:hypothetical protein
MILLWWLICAIFSPLFPASGATVEMEVSYAYFVKFFYSNNKNSFNLLHFQNLTPSTTDKLSFCNSFHLWREQLWLFTSVHFTKKMSSLGNIIFMLFMRRYLYMFDSWTSGKDAALLKASALTYRNMHIIFL